MVFFVFCLLKCAEIPNFIVLFEHQPKLAPKMGKKNDNFSHFAKHRFINKPRFVATPLLTKKLVFFNFDFFNFDFFKQKH